MIKFVPVNSGVFVGKSANPQYIPHIIDMFMTYKNNLIDDYFPLNNLQTGILEEIDALAPWFFIILKNDVPAGAVWLSHWHGNKTKNHSCQMHGFLNKKFRGKTGLLIANTFIHTLFNIIEVQRIQMEIPEFNHPAKAFAERLGFSKEGIIKCATIKDGQPVNNVLYAKLKGE